MGIGSVEVVGEDGLAVGAPVVDEEDKAEEGQEVGDDLGRLRVLMVLVVSDCFPLMASLSSMSVSRQSRRPLCGTTAQAVLTVNFLLSSWPRALY